nr:AAA family ATPase [Steroidobacter cummioxidans]
MTTSTDTRRELEALLKSRVPLIVIETRDEPRAVALLASLAPTLVSNAHTPVFQWTVTEGLRRLDISLAGAQQHNAEPDMVLKSMRSTPTAGVYILLDFHPFLADPVNVRLLKDICQDYDRVARTVVLISHEIQLPRELDHLCARLRLAFPDRNERLGIVERVASEWSRTYGQRVKTDRKSLELLVENLGGLSTGDTERLARKVIFDDGALLPTDLPAVMQAKYELLNRGGVLAFEYDTAQFADLGGMTRLKEWLRLRKPAFDGSAPNLEAPKGVLLLGVQGCGKSVAAKAAAGIFGVPLLRLDFAAIHNKYIGESERNLRESLNTADTMSPCVLWIDEIEKGVSIGDGDNGTSRRLLGTFLTWLAEKENVASVRGSHRERHLLAAARAGTKGTSGRDFLRRPPKRRDPGRHSANPREEAEPHSRRQPCAATGHGLRRFLGRGDRTGRCVGCVRRSRQRRTRLCPAHPPGDPRHAPALRHHGGKDRRTALVGRRAHCAGGLGPSS